MPLLRAFWETHSTGVKYVTLNTQVTLNKLQINLGDPSELVLGLPDPHVPPGPEPPLGWGIPVLCHASSAKPRLGWWSPTVETSS